MKIAILTWLHNGNFGTVLQAYALQRYLRNEGYDVQNIDLLPSVIQKTKNLIKQGNSPILFLEKWEGFQAKKACPNPEVLKVRYERTDKFLETNFNLTKRFSKFTDLKSIKNSFDVYICGSDQIWSPTYFSPSYFFDFTDDDKKRISYACSFGVSDMTKSKADRTKRLIERFDAVSVREASGQKIVFELTGKQAVVNVDPTMLLTAEDWNTVVSKRLIAEDYMFCYFLSYNKVYWEKAISESKARGLKLVLVPTTKESYSIDGAIIADAGPSEWLSLIKHASLVATDSFHGSVFSIIHRKNFMVFKRFDDSKKESRNTRVYNLLETYGLSKCLVNDIDSYKPVNISPDDYQAVIDLVKSKANESKTWIKTAIES